MTEARKRIGTAAKRLYARHGAEGVSMRRVASELGVTATSLYRHFKDKEALVESIAEAGFSVLEEYFHSARPVQGSRVLGLIKRYLDFALAEPRFYEVMFLRSRKSVRTFPRDFADHRSATFDILRSAVEEEIREERLRRDDSLKVSLSIWAQAHGLISLSMQGRFAMSRADFRRLYGRSLQYLYRGLASDPKQGGGR